MISVFWDYFLLSDQDINKFLLKLGSNRFPNFLFNEKS